MKKQGNIFESEDFIPERVPKSITGGHYLAKTVASIFDSVGTGTDR